MASAADPAVDPARLLDLAMRGARAAGRELMNRYGKVEGLTTKSSATDPVTDADRSAESTLVKLITSERPDDGLLGEEGAERESANGIRWVIDPLDGTVNYLYELDNFAVSIAAEDQEGALVGVVHNPVTKRTFHAVRGVGASVDGRPLRVNDPVPMHRALLATGFGYDAEIRRQQGTLLGRLLPQVRDIRRIGSAALDLCAVASGSVDAYFEEGVKAWDVAAGGLIAQEAGARATRTSPIAGQAGLLVAGPALFDELIQALVKIRDAG
ncbi:MAG TPA: inositol monophosphatase family protein [Nakamurella sp.]